MIKPRTPRAFFGGRFTTRLAPVVAALALSWSSVYLQAAPQQDIQTVLLEFANDKDTTPLSPVTTPPSLLSAKPDDLVYAVYKLAPNYVGDDAGLANLAAAAIELVGTKARSDINTIAPRLVNAALLGSGQTDNAALAARVAVRVALVNSQSTSSKLKLTAAGRAAVVAQALKLTSGQGAAAGDVIAEAVQTNNLTSNSTGSTADAKLQYFATVTLRLVKPAPVAGTDFGDTAVAGFIRNVVGDVTVVSKDTFVTNVAAAMVSSKSASSRYPDAAGQIVAGYTSTLGSDTAISTFTQAAIKNSKLAPAVAAIVGGAASSLTTVAPEAFATGLVNSLVASKATTGARANIASGAIRAGGDVALVVDAVLTGTTVQKTLTKAEVASFAGAAAIGTGDAAGEIAAKLSTKFPASVTPTVSDLGTLGKAVVKAIAVSSPTSAATVGAQLISANTTLFQNDNTDVLKTALAKSLAGASPTNGAVTGYAVAGVANSFASQTEGTFAALGATTISAAPKAALNIAKELSALDAIPSTGYASFAKSLAFASQKYAAPIAAGVAVTAVGGNNAAGLGGVSGSPGQGQSAGDIVVAVANASISNNALRPKLLTIASSVALAVDVERIADIGNKVGSTLGSDVKYPTTSSFGALASSLAKAINTKPLTGTANRVDELGELAAELTRAAILRLGTSADADKLASTLSSVGTSILKALSGSQPQNGGAFAADRRDAARDIAGAIAQTISVMGIAPVGGTAAISDANVNALLSLTGKLAKALAKEAKTFASAVNGLDSAFADVLAAKNSGSTDRLVTTGGRLELVSNNASGGTISGQGRYEIGAVIDAETPIVSLP